MAKCHAGWSLQGQVGQTESSSPRGSRQQARSCLPLTSRGWLVAALPRCPAKGEGLGALAPRALWASGHTWRPAGTEANTCSETAAMLRPQVPRASVGAPGRSRPVGAEALAEGGVVFVCQYCVRSGRSRVGSCCAIVSGNNQGKACLVVGRYALPALTCCRDVARTGPGRAPRSESREGMLVSSSSRCAPVTVWTGSRLQGWSSSVSACVDHLLHGEAGQGQVPPLQSLHCLHSLLKLLI